jgi:hypothetical protein
MPVNEERGFDSGSENLNKHESCDILHSCIQNGGFYSVLCPFELNIDAGKYFKKIIPTAIYVFFLI